MLRPSRALIRTYNTSYYDGMPDVNVYLLDEGMGDYDEPTPLRRYCREKHRWVFGDQIIRPRSICRALGLWVFTHPTLKECELLYSPSRNEYISEQVLTDVDKGILKIFNKREDQLSCEEISSLCNKIAEVLESDMPEGLASDIRNLARSLYQKADKEARDKISPFLVLEDL